MFQTGDILYTEQRNTQKLTSPLQYMYEYIGTGEVEETSEKYMICRSLYQHERLLLQPLSDVYMTHFNLFDDKDSTEIERIVSLYKQCGCDIQNLDVSYIIWKPHALKRVLLKTRNISGDCNKKAIKTLATWNLFSQAK